MKYKIPRDVKYFLPLSFLFYGKIFRAGARTYVYVRTPTCKDIVFACELCFFRVSTHARSLSFICQLKCVSHGRERERETGGRGREGYLHCYTGNNKMNFNDSAERFYGPVVFDESARAGIKRASERGRALLCLY